MGLIVAGELLEHDCVVLLRGIADEDKDVVALVKVSEAALRCREVSLRGAVDALMLEHLCEVLLRRSGRGGSVAVEVDAKEGAHRRPELVGGPDLDAPRRGLDDDVAGVGRRCQDIVFEGVAV